MLAGIVRPPELHHHTRYTERRVSAVKQPPELTAGRDDVPSAQEFWVSQVLGVASGLTACSGDNPRRSGGAMPEDPADTLGRHSKNRSHRSICGADPMLVQAVQDLFEEISAVHDWMMVLRSSPDLGEEAAEHPGCFLVDLHSLG